MSLLHGTNQYVCDRCGENVDNASISLCAVTTDLDPDAPGTLRHLHFCRVNNCVSKVLSARNLQSYVERRKNAESAVAEANGLRGEIDRLTQLVAQLTKDKD